MVCVVVGVDVIVDDIFFMFLLEMLVIGECDIVVLNDDVKGSFLLLIVVNFFLDENIFFGDKFDVISFVMMVVFKFGNIFVWDVIVFEFCRYVVGECDNEIIFKVDKDLIFNWRKRI